MKSIKTQLLSLFVFVLSVILTASCFADDPNPPIVPGEHGVAGDVPVGAPIDGGLGILLILGAGYGARKLFISQRDKDHN